MKTVMLFIKQLSCLNTGFSLFHTLVYQLVLNINLGYLECSCLYGQMLMMAITFQHNVLGC